MASLVDPEPLAALGRYGIFLGMLVPEQYDGLGVDTTTYFVPSIVSK